MEVIGTKSMSYQLSACVSQVMQRDFWASACINAWLHEINAWLLEINTSLASSLHYPKDLSFTCLVWGFFLVDALHFPMYHLGTI